MNRKKTLIVLAAGRLQIPAIATAKRLGIRVVALDGDPCAPGLALADLPVVIDITNPKACLEIAVREKADGVIHICCEVAMNALGLINEALGLPGLNPAAVARATNKAKMRRAFEAAGAPSPRSFGVATEKEAEAVVELLQWPIIIKPSRNSGSRGVTFLADQSDRPAFLAAFSRAVGCSRDHDAVIEEFVEGPEFSVEILVWDQNVHVLAVTDKRTTGAPFFVETGHSQPSLFRCADLQAVTDAAIRGVKALGIDWSAAHAEVRLSPRGPVLMEIGARLGGDFITTELVPLSTGIDMVAASVHLALGTRPNVNERMHSEQGAAIRYFTPPSGIVHSINGVDQAKSMPGVRIVEMGLNVGELVPELTSSLSRVGHVIATGTTGEEAIVRAEAAIETVRIVTKSR